MSRGLYIILVGEHQLQVPTCLIYDSTVDDLA